MKTVAVQSLKADHKLPVLLAAAGLPRSTYFYHQARLRASDPRAELKGAVTAIFTNLKCYGHRRIRLELRRQGWWVSKKTVWKLMRELGLVCPTRRRKRPRPSGAASEKAPNLLAQQFRATAPGEKLVTDVTEFKVCGQRVYLSPVMDLFDGQIISYTIDRSPGLAFVLESVEQALASLDTGARPLVHSDQGFQYRHQAYRGLLDRHGATQSMSRKGACLDNAMIENFFGHVKTEWFYPGSFPSITEVEAGLHEYIRWYNHDRIRNTHDGLPPVVFRARAMAV